MIVTFFDTETTGFVQQSKPHDDRRQPHLMQLAMIMVDTKTWLPLMELSTMVATNEEPSEGAFNAHGISTAKSQEFGIQPKTAAAFVRHFALRSQRMVAHNKEFDIKVFQVEQARHEGKPEILDGMDIVCTMAVAKPIMKLPASEKQIKAGFGGFKSPKLSEAVMYFLGEELPNAHNAMVDTIGCMKVYRKLVELGHITE